MSNCLFLATDQQALLRAAGLIELWANGYVEPIVPPPQPLHLFAQQIMALALQLGGLDRNAWREWIGAVPCFAQLDSGQTEEILRHMIASDILWEDGGVLWFGKRGEAEFGFRNFMDLLAVFTSEPLFSVRCGQSELGFVHESSFAPRKNSDKILLLGGRSWAVSHIDWQKRIAYVEPAEQSGRSRWIGSGAQLSYELCQAIRRILATDQMSELWSRRAREELTQARAHYSWVREGATAVVTSPDGLAWWTFAGDRANTALSQRFGQLIGSPTESDSLAITADVAIPPDDLSRAIDEIRHIEPHMLAIEIADEMLDGLKFSSCLPQAMARSILQLRLADPEALGRTLCEAVHYVSVI